MVLVHAGSHQARIRRKLKTNMELAGVNAAYLVQWQGVSGLKYIGGGTMQVGYTGNEKGADNSAPFRYSSRCFL
jgi:hypothetical protein